MGNELTFKEKLLKLSEPVDIKNIDFRVQSISQKKYATILAYKDARYDMNILDSIIGPENWQRKHEEIKGVIYCSIGIFDPDRNQWVWKQDAGTESQTEAQKGAASDSFKRAGFNWGIGRELYDFPRILVQCDDSEVTEVVTPQGKKYKANYSFTPNEWTWGISRDEKTNIITQLAAKDKNGRIRFKWK